MSYQTVKGTYDLLPDRMVKFNILSDLFRQFLNLYGYGEIKTPVFEYTGVFQKENDRVSKEPDANSTFELEIGLLCIAF